LSPDSTAHKLRIALLRLSLIAHVPFQVRCALRDYARLALLASCQSHIVSMNHTYNEKCFHTFKTAYGRLLIISL